MNLDFPKFTPLESFENFSEQTVTVPMDAQTFDALKSIIPINDAFLNGVIECLKHIKPAQTASLPAPLRAWIRDYLPRMRVIEPYVDPLPTLANPRNYLCHDNMTVIFATKDHPVKMGWSKGYPLNITKWPPRHALACRTTVAGHEVVAFKQIGDLCEGQTRSRSGVTRSVVWDVLGDVVGGDASRFSDRIRKGYCLVFHKAEEPKIPFRTEPLEIVKG